MKVSASLYAMSFAQMGLAVPIPATRSYETAFHLQETGLLIGITRVSIHYTQPVPTVNHAAGYVGYVEKSGSSFNNRPVSPSKNMPPILVLAAPRPLKTAYLQSLSTQLGSRKESVLNLAGDGTPETMEPMTLEKGLEK
ncbi:hypothetical protein LY78DRAFT_730850 [Colletotrichum sublineola]|nr:hypothetical protein LY78DRAFT_730850 [Colletotrichum sublineola]